MFAHAVMHNCEAPTMIVQLLLTANLAEEIQMEVLTPMTSIFLADFRLPLSLMVPFSIRDY